MDNERVVLIAMQKTATIDDKFVSPDTVYRESEEKLRLISHIKLRVKK